MEYLRDLAKTSPHEVVKSKILELIQVWAFAFRSCITYRAVQVNFLDVLELQNENQIHSLPIFIRFSSFLKTN